MEKIDRRKLAVVMAAVERYVEDERASSPAASAVPGSRKGWKAEGLKDAMNTRVAWQMRFYR